MSSTRAFTSGPVDRDGGWPENGSPEAPAGDRAERPASRELSCEGLRELLRASDEAVLVADAETRVLYANPACAGLFGLTPEEMVGRLGVDFVEPHQLLVAQETLSRVLDRGGAPVSATLDLAGGGGETVTVDVRLVNHLDTPGIGGLVAYLSPSTANERELAESYRALFDNALIGMGVADMQGKLLAFNDAMLAPGGYTREDIEDIGNVAKLYADESDRSRMLQILRANGYVWREPVPFLAKDGSVYPTLLSLTPVVFLGRPCLYATVEVGEDER